MENSPIRSLLWSPAGSGEHYNGPGSFTYRLYSKAPPGAMRVTLAHGASQQENYPLFHKQVHIARMSSSPWDQYQYIRKGRQWIEEHHSEFDVMHSVSAFHYSILPASTAEKFGIPSVIFVSNHLGQLGDRKNWKRYLGLAKKRRKMAMSLSCLIAMSQDINEELLGYGVPEEKIARIPMGVNTSVFAPAATKSDKQTLRAQLGWQDMPTIIFAGALVKRKRPDLLVEAVGKLKQQGAEFQLIMAGPPNEAEYAADMEQRAVDLGLANHIRWMGFVQDMAPLFQASDIFCLPSENEGMAAALIESMACGLAPVVTPVSGSADVVHTGENGFIVQASVDGIAHAMHEYSKDTGLAELHGQRSLAIARKQYSNEVVYNAYESLFRRLMSGQPAAG